MQRKETPAEIIQRYKAFPNQIWNLVENLLEKILDLEEEVKKLKKEINELKTNK